MKRCTKCILPESFPHISFNDEGVCNFCQSFKGQEKVQEDKSQYLEKFKNLIANVKGKSDYDCAVSYSGGKDSSYTLYVLKEVFRETDWQAGIGLLFGSYVAAMVCSLENGLSFPLWSNEVIEIQ